MKTPLIFSAFLLLLTHSSPAIAASIKCAGNTQQRFVARETPKNLMVYLVPKNRINPSQNVIQFLRKNRGIKIRYSCAQIKEVPGFDLAGHMRCTDYAEDQKFGLKFSKGIPPQFIVMKSGYITPLRLNKIQTKDLTKCNGPDKFWSPVTLYSIEGSPSNDWGNFYLIEMREHGINLI